MSHHPSARDLVAAATNKKLSHQAQAVLAAFRNEPGGPEIVSVNPPSPKIQHPPPNRRKVSRTKK